ncbi:hypothetical protein [Flavobacterium sp.]|uniref:hypothetical protein n=1 Tax=Flavobacterium sp. TaxID=239 RepID=UPI00262CD27C|nr:hypothetical protein [Flavobacterium sp.]
MKTLKLIAIGLFFFASFSMQSQVSVNVNIGSPPAWGPVGYTEVEYYYLPDIEVYYDVPRAQYIYLNGGHWIHSRYLPRPYRGYDLYSGYKVVLNDYHGRTPYVYFKDHKVKYHKGFKGNGPQKTIGVRGNKGNSNNHIGKSQGAKSQGGNSQGGKGNGGKGHGGGKGKK